MINNEKVYFVIGHKMEGYEKWTDVIDQINMCECVVSSSLHGLIVAEAYGVPARWICVENNLLGGNFKFWDFYESIEKYNMLPLQVDNFTSISTLYNEARSCQKGKLDLQPLINSCPFRIHP